MHWLAKRPGWRVREASHVRQWKISPRYSSGRVDLILTHWTSDGFAVETKVAQCMTAAEAQIFAAPLYNAGHPVGTPCYCMIMSDGQMVQPDTLMIEPRLFRLAPSAFYGRNAGPPDPIILTFTVACFAILTEHIELNSSYAARLEDGQQHALVELFAAGYNWPEEEAEPFMLGMSR